MSVRVTEQLADIIGVYVEPRYFQDSRAKNPKKLFCPFGKDCFYQHLNDDGTKYEFKDGVDVCMKVCAATRSNVQISRNVFQIRSRRDLLRDIYNYESHLFGAMGPWAGGILTVDLAHDDISPDVNPDDGPRIRSRPPNPLVIPYTLSRRGSNSSVDANPAAAAQRLSTSDADPPRDEEIRMNSSLIEQVQRMASNTANAPAPTNSCLQAERFIASFEDALLASPLPLESGRSSPAPHWETSPPPLEPDDVESSSSQVPRPPTVFQRINQNEDLVIEIEEENGNTESGASLEPPFVTDGRGRVVWSAVNNSESSDVQ